MRGAGVKLSMLKWARKRSDRDNYIRKHFPEIESWERGAKSPSLRDMEKFAQATYVPIGYLFLDEPPDIRLPVSDFRSIGGASMGPPSPHLLDTVYLCQQRQGWYRKYAESAGEEKLDFVGSMSVDDDVVHSASQIRRALKLDDEARLKPDNSDTVRQRLVSEAENLGILVMVSDVVANDAARKLDVKEFHGFALAAAWAPLVFVNGKDGVGAQPFTMAHALAHIWLGQSGVSGNSVRDVPDNVVEKWCSAVAAEMLAPSDVMRKAYDTSADVTAETIRLARLFNVSNQIILRRMYDVGGLGRADFQNKYDGEVRLAAKREKKKTKKIQC